MGCALYPNLLPAREYVQTLVRGANKHARRYFSRHDAWITVCARRRDGVVRARLRAAADGRLDFSSLVTGGNFFLATGMQPTQRAPDAAADEDEDEDETDELIAMHLYHDEELEAELEEEEEERTQRERKSK